MKRWPPICEDNTAEYSRQLKNPPAFVQIMLFLDNDEAYNGALLNVDVKSNGYEKLTFIKRDEALYPEDRCVSAVDYQYGKSNPSVLPSTLFQVSYLPCQ